MKIDILSLFPEMFTPVTECSMLGRAVENKIIEINLVNIRDYSLDKHKKTDDYPFGGGVGMVFLPEPVFGALRAVEADKKKLVYMSPRGKILDRDKIKELASLPELVILCGHYEGIDQRILDCWEPEEISIGDYVLTGGELAAMVLMDAVSRFIPEVLGSSESAEAESVYSGLLEYPQYTRPREYEGLSVPQVLLSGNHKEIKLWEFRQSLLLTFERRPDMFAAFLAGATELSKDERKCLIEVLREKGYNEDADRLEALDPRKRRARQ